MGEQYNSEIKQWTLVDNGTGTIQVKEPEDLQNMMLDHEGDDE